MATDRTDIIDSELSDMVSAAIGSAARIADLENSAVMGSLREIVVRKLLRELLPHTCEARTGMAVSSFGSEHPSTQDDVLIVDTECLPPVLAYESSGVYPIESVLSRIEVKSTLGRHELDKTIHDCRHFRTLQMNVPAMDKNGDPWPPSNDALVGLFAFKCEREDPWVLYRELMVGAGGSRALDFLCVVGKGFWHWGKTPDNQTERWRVCPCDRKHSEVLAFLALLLDRLPQIREGRKRATFSRYVECLRSDKMRDA